MYHQRDAIRCLTRAAPATRESRVEIRDVVIAKARRDGGCGCVPARKKASGVADGAEQPEIASARCGSSMRHVALSGFIGGSTGNRVSNGHERVAPG